MFAPGIYPVITEKYCRGRSSVAVLKEVVEAGVVAVQLREKDLSKRQLYSLALQWKDILKNKSTAFIINDHLDLALAVGADGVHLGQSDLPLVVARKLAPDLIIGISTHNLAQALQAQQQASYVNLGPVFATQTKQHTPEPLGLQMVQNIGQQLTIPFTVMGAIKKANLPAVLATGARRIAMVTEITQADNIYKQVSELNEIFQKFVTTVN